MSRKSACTSDSDLHRKRCQRPLPRACFARVVSCACRVVGRVVLLYRILPFGSSSVWLLDLLFLARSLVSAIASSKLYNRSDATTANTTTNRRRRRKLDAIVVPLRSSHSMNEALFGQ